MFAETDTSYRVSVSFCCIIGLQWQQGEANGESRLQQGVQMAAGVSH